MKIMEKWPQVSRRRPATRTLILGWLHSPWQSTFSDLAGRCFSATLLESTRHLVSWLQRLRLAAEPAKLLHADVEGLGMSFGSGRCERVTYLVQGSRSLN